MAYSPYWIYRSKRFDVSFSFGKGSTMGIYQIRVDGIIVFSCDDYAFTFEVYHEWGWNMNYNPTSIAYQKRVSFTRKDGRNSRILQQTDSYNNRITT